MEMREGRRRIEVLSPEEARKIAAGEVVDRPAALVREFLDNAIDAGAEHIEVSIGGGGISRVEVSDDGSGMEREDLELCWLTHATSKIRSLEDLKTASTLGFRGEALAAAAAVSRLEIISAPESGGAWRLQVGPGESHPPELSPASRARGATVRSLGLFDTIPARKKFLKREGAEGELCKTVFSDKAMAFPALSFRFFQDGKLKTFLPPAPSLRERFAALALGPGELDFLHEVSAQGKGFSVRIIAGGPELYRNDRRRQFIFANRRRIQDYGFSQALEYGLQGWFPNGVHPVGAVFIDIDPALADFNIHPAKREARFADPGAIHHAITQALQSLTRENRTWMADSRFQSLHESAFPLPSVVSVPSVDKNSAGSSASSGCGASALALEALLADPPAFAALPGRRGEAVAESPPLYGGTAPGIRLAGRLFGLFILIEKGESFFIIDQHAAHERLLYDKFLAGPVPAQELLVPIPFETESEAEDRFLQARREELARLGIVLASEEGAWRIEALPEGWRLGDRETVRELLSLKEAGENLAERWAASLACHGAIKDGAYLDDVSALALAEAALALPVPRCPHGRPLWTELKREELFRAVRRS